MNLSFVIPAHNEEALLGACLESVRCEIERGRYPADIVVVDNASTDRTAEIAASFPGVRVIREPRKGLVRARAAGYAATSGVLVANVDADTEIPPGWLATVFSEFESDPHLVALSGPFIYRDLPPLKRWISRAFILTYPAVHFLVHRIFRVGAILQGGNFIVRRSAMEKIGGYDTSIEFYGEDTDVARRIARVGRVKWTLSLPIYASGRRLAHEGIARMGLRYAVNFFWTTFAKKPFTRNYVDVRDGSRS